MQVRLKPEIEAYLKTQVDAGRYSSLEEAIEGLARDDAAAQDAVDAADLDWAKPFIEKGLHDLESGRVVPAGAVHDRIRRRLSKRS
jgi:Arc/MetJ-type ribon-helix-helix transcriptional regulator